MTKARLLRPASAALLVTSLALAGCQQPPKEASFACPRIALLDGASQQTLPTGTADAAGKSRLVKYSGGCRYDGEGLTLAVTVTFALVANADAALPATEMPYFAAVQNRAGELVAKRRYSVGTGELAAGASRRVTHKLEAAFDLPDGAEPGGYTVLIGFPQPASQAPVETPRGSAQ